MEISPVYGLVLAGGKSSRMGRDKGEIHYHGVPQRDHLYQLLGSRCDRTFLSLRSDQQGRESPGIATILDKDQYRGPFNGLHSAHSEYPDAAWLVLACDLPLMDGEAIDFLLDKRNPEKVATALATGKSGLPEPLAAIWEPHGIRRALDYLQTAESSCPRKFLLNSDIELVRVPNDEWLANANLPEEREAILNKLQDS